MIFLTKLTLKLKWRENTNSWFLTFGAGVFNIINTLGKVCICISMCIFIYIHHLPIYLSICKFFQMVVFCCYCCWLVCCFPQGQNFWCVDWTAHLTWSLQENLDYFLVCWINVTEYHMYPSSHLQKQYSWFWNYEHHDIKKVTCVLSQAPSYGAVFGTGCSVIGFAE